MMTKICRIAVRAIAIVGFGIACGAPAVLAAEAPVATERQLVIPEKPRTHEVWLNLGGFSRLFSSNDQYNKTNRGVGIEYRINPELVAMAGSYYNSVRRTTTYAAVTYQPFVLGNFKVGASVGLMDGYPAVQRGGTFFAALPMVTYEGTRFGVNLGIIPSMPKVDGAVLLQFKVRVL